MSPARPVASFEALKRPVEVAEEVGNVLIRSLVMVDKEPVLAGIQDVLPSWACMHTASVEGIGHGMFACSSAQQAMPSVLSRLESDLLTLYSRPLFHEGGDHLQA